MAAVCGFDIGGGGGIGWRKNRGGNGVGGGTNRIACIRAEVFGGMDKEFFAGGYRFCETGSNRERLYFFDTCEASLFVSGKVLFRLGDSLRLQELEGGWMAGDKREIPWKKRGDFLVSDLPDGKLKREVAGSAGACRLLPAFSLEMRKRFFAGESGGGGGACSLVLGCAFFAEKQRKGDSRACLEIRAEGVGGKEGRKIAARVAGDFASFFSEEERAGLEHFFSAAGLLSGKYRHLPEKTIDPEEDAGATIARSVLAALAAAAENEPGIVADTDTEFLHRYRVCLRKARALAGLSEGVFPEEKRAELKGVLSCIFAKTSKLRDADTQCLREEETKESLPPEAVLGLEEVFADFRAARKKERRELVRYFLSEEYRSAVESLRAFFTDTKNLGGGEGRVRVGEFVAEQVGRRCKKVLRRAEALKEGAEDEQIHELRIDAKKLRYTCENFRGLREERAWEEIEKPFRELQSTLGRFNDLCVHERQALDYWKEKKASAGNGASGDVGFALGALVARLGQEKSMARKEVFRAVREFLLRGGARRVRSLFSEKKEKGEEGKK